MPQFPAKSAAVPLTKITKIWCNQTACIRVAPPQVEPTTGWVNKCKYTTHNSHNPPKLGFNELGICARLLNG